VPRLRSPPHQVEPVDVGDCSLRIVSEEHEAMTDAQYCASIPEYRKTLGAHSDKVARLTALCKQAGYSTGD